MLPHHHSFAEAFGVGGAYIVLVQHIEHGAACELRDDGERTNTERDGGQYKVLQGEALVATLVNVEPTAGEVQPRPVAEHKAKHICYDDAHEKRWRRYAHDAGENRGGVHPCILLHRRQHAEWYAYGDGNEHGCCCEHECAGQRLQQYIAHRFFCLIRFAQVRQLNGKLGIAADEEAAQVLLLNIFLRVNADGRNIVEIKNELLPLRLIEVEFFADVGLRGGVARLSHHQPCRVAKALEE